jgi:hypothetical protein
MAKRQRVDSITAAQRIVAGAVREILPPGHVYLADGHWPFWRSVVAEFPKADWTDHQLEIAAQLTKAIARLEREGNALDLQSSVIEGRVNPLVAVVRDYTNSVMSLRRNLSLHARAQGGEARDVSKRRDAGLSIEAEAGEATSLLN